MQFCSNGSQQVVVKFLSAMDFLPSFSKARSLPARYLRVLPGQALPPPGSKMVPTT